MVQLCVDIPFQVITIPFPFQSLMKLLLVAMMSGVALYASPGVMVALFPHPLKANELVISLLVTMGGSLLIPLIIRLDLMFGISLIG